MTSALSSYLKVEELLHIANDVETLEKIAGSKYGRSRGRSDDRHISLRTRLRFTPENWLVKLQYRKSYLFQPHDTWAKIAGKELTLFARACRWCKGRPVSAQLAKVLRLHDGFDQPDTKYRVLGNIYRLAAEQDLCDVFRVLHAIHILHGINVPDWRDYTKSKNFMMCFVDGLILAARLQRHRIFQDFRQPTLSAKEPTPRLLLAHALRELVMDHDYISCEMDSAAFDLLFQCARASQDELQEGQLCHIAARFRSPYLLMRCVEAGDRVCEQDEDGRTALHYAVLPSWGRSLSSHSQVAASPATIRMILDADPQKRCIAIKDSIGRLPLHFAASCSPDEVVRMLIESDVSHSTVLSRDGRGQIPLHCAARYSFEHSVSLLLEADKSGRSVTISDNNGDLPIHEAFANHWTIRRSIVQALVGADREGKTLLARGSEGKTPLELAHDQYGKFKDRKHYEPQVAELSGIIEYLIEATKEASKRLDATDIA